MAERRQKFVLAPISFPQRCFTLEEALFGALAGGDFLDDSDEIFRRTIALSDQPNVENSPIWGRDPCEASA